MPSKVGHVVRLVPVLIGGTYASSNAFLPAQPKDIKALLAERKCYVVTRSEKNSGGGSIEGEKYLLACRTYPVGKTLDFFFIDTSSKSKIAIPVKYLKVTSGGGEDKGKKLNLDFTWGNSSSFETPPFIFNTPFFDFGLGESQSKDLYLMNLCKEVEDGVFSDIPSSKKILKCVWEGKDRKLWADYWVEAEESKISPPPPPAKPSS